MNKNVSTGAVIRAKCGTDYRAADVHKLGYWWTIKPLYTHPGSHNAQRYSLRIHAVVNSRSDCAAVRSAKKYHFKMLNVDLVLDIFCRYIVHGIQTHEALVFSYVASLLI